MRYPLMILFLLWDLSSHSQTILSGTVKNEEGEPMEMVLVSALNPQDSTIIAYAGTDEQGAYTISLTECKLETLLLRMAGFNVQKEYRMVENRSQKIDWTGSKENTLLKEVQIKAQKLWGSKDTLNYLVAAYTRDHDITIGDVLKRLPGIDIKENGSITYQGIPINKFYVENMDVLQGRYNIATKGIKAEDVTTVQLLEHHQHVRALDDQMPPEAAAINLKLKKEKRGVWTHTADVGLGANERFLWNITGHTMFFGKKEHHVILYDTENDGRGSNLLTSHYGVVGVAGHIITSATEAPNSPVGNNRRNNYHQLACNNLWKLNDSTELHIDACYKHNLVRTETDRTTTYMLPDGSSRILAENIASHGLQDATNITLNYERNAKKEYLQNVLILTGHRNDVRNTDKTDEYGNNHTLGVADRIHWVHRTNHGGGFDLQSQNSFSSTPQRLTVSPGVFPALLADGQPYVSATQTATVNNFKSTNSITQINDIRRHRLTFAPSAHANVEHIHMESCLTAGKSIMGDMSYTHLDLGGGLGIRYTQRQFYAQLHLPLSVRPTFLTGSSHSTAGRPHPYFWPSASFNWRMTDNWTWNGNLSWGSMPSSWQNLYTSYVLHSYSNLSRYEGSIYDTELLNGRVKVDYKEILHQVFAWLEFSGSRTKADMTIGTHINEQGYSEMLMVRQPHVSTNLLLRANLRKDFDWNNLSIELSGNTARGNTQILRQNVFTRYRSNRYAASFKLDMKPAKWFDFDYNTHWSRYESQSEEGFSSRITTNWNNVLNFNATIVEKHLWLTFGVSHEYNNLLHRKHHEYLSAQLRYHIKKMDYSLRAENLMNMREYSTLSIDDMTESYTIYHLQPLTVMLRTSVRF